MIEIAREYLKAGLCVLPARRAEKRPVVGRWKQYQTRKPNDAELSAWFANIVDAVCILCGAVSGNLEIIDFDAGGELFDAWWKKIPEQLRAKLAIETTQSGGRHVIYRCVSKVSGNLKLAQRRDGKKTVTLIETRGEGGLFLCAPTVGYEIVQGDLCDLPLLSEAERDILLQAAWDLNEYVPPVVDGPTRSTNVGRCGNSLADNSHNGPISAENSNNCHFLAENAERPGDDFNNRGDVRAVLEQFGWSRIRGGENEYWRRPGKNSGWSATLKERVFYVFSANAAPFEPNRAYSPFAVYALLACGGDFEQAARSLAEDGYGSDSLVDNPTGVDISAIMRMSAADGDCRAENGQSRHYVTENADSDDSLPEIADPGLIPEHLFHVPGFIERLMDFTLANAPYPNVGLAFCGAMALQSYLGGRKVMDIGELRPNIYLLALASSGTGKDYPRKVNARVMFEIGHIAALGDKFASGEGLADALFRNGAMLFQNDEMDGVLRQINSDRDNKRESMPNVMLTVYTSADTTYPMRAKAGKEDPGHIDQPHLTLFGTATPRHFYESLSERMLTNGLFARMLLVDIGKRGKGQTPGSVRKLPEAVLQTAHWWAEFQPGTRRGNLLEVHPEPRVVPYTPDAQDAVDHLRSMAERKYDDAHEGNDEVAKIAWSRTHENAMKLALIRACSVNHEDPVIDLAAVEWASAFAMHQTNRQLFLAQSYVAETQFDGDCLKVLRKLREAPGQRIPHQVLLKRMKMRTKDFKELIETLLQRNDIVAVPVKTSGRTGVVYELAGVKKGEAR